MEEKKSKKIYYDIHQFKGNIFQDNIDTINNLYFGQGIMISDIPYIYRSESEKKNYLSTNCLLISSGNNNDKKKMICYPESFLHLVFFHDNLLFYLNLQNNLIVFKFENKVYFKYEYQQRQETVIIKKNENANEVSEIIQKLKKLDEDKSLNGQYEVLCDILLNDLNEGQNIDKPKKIIGTLNFKIEVGELKYECTFKNYKYEVDGFGQLKEELNLGFGMISFKEGISDLIRYVNAKLNNGYVNKFINNAFKSPILYKNFKDEKIPQNQAIIFEMKSGFDLLSLISQLKERINIVNNCLFEENEKPMYFIGIVNFNSKNIDKLEKFYEISLVINENTLIIATIDYEYCGLNIRTKIHSEYLLNKKLDNLELKLDNKFDRLNEKIDNNMKLLLNIIGNFHSNHFKSVLEIAKKEMKEEKKESV